MSGPYIAGPMAYFASAAKKFTSAWISLGLSFCEKLAGMIPGL
jgi:hypothetical protein